MQKIDMRIENNEVKFTTCRVSLEVLEYVDQKKLLGDSFDNALRRILGLKPIRRVYTK